MRVLERRIEIVRQNKRKEGERKLGRNLNRARKERTHEREGEKA